MIGNDTNASLLYRSAMIGNNDTNIIPLKNDTAAFLTQTVCLDDTTVKFEIWDTAGQERYHSLAPMYYRGAQAAIVVYDITNQVSSYAFEFSVFVTPVSSHCHE